MFRQVVIVYMVVARGIFLIGPMASGKTTVGKSLAGRLDREFFDSDAVIENRSGLSVADIFERRGEKVFREYEEQAIAELTQKPGIVLATGGGVVMSAANRRYLHERGTVVWLRIDIDSQLERIGDPRTRPLLESHDVRAGLQDANRQRYDLYGQAADFFVDVGAGSVDDTVEEIINGLSFENGDRRRH